ncbi:MAG: hypothetical protein WCQ32_02785 [bacterium]
MVETWRLNLFHDDDPDFQKMCKDGTLGDYLDHSFKRDVVVIKTGDEPKLLPCAYAWLYSPDWNSFSDKAEREIIRHDIVVDDHKDIHVSKKFYSLFY